MVYNVVASAHSTHRFIQVFIQITMSKTAEEILQENLSRINRILGKQVCDPIEKAMKAYANQHLAELQSNIIKAMHKEWDNPKSLLHLELRTHPNLYPGQLDWIIMSFTPPERIKDELDSPPAALEEESQKDLWIEFGNRINSFYLHDGDFFGIRPILDILKKEFHLTRKQQTK